MGSLQACRAFKPDQWETNKLHHLPGGQEKWHLGQQLLVDPIWILLTITKLQYNPHVITNGQQRVHLGWEPMSVTWVSWLYSRGG